MFYSVQALWRTKLFRCVGPTCALLVLASCAQTVTIRPAPLQEIVASEEHAQTMLGRMVGRWELSGVIAGEHTVHDVEASWVLQHKYVEIREISRELGDNGAPAYEAIIYIGWLNDRYVCFWFDNTDVASTEVRCEASAATPNVIPFQFRNREGELIFLNTFEYQPGADTWTWVMESPQGDATQTFGRVTLRRF